MRCFILVLVMVQNAVEGTRLKSLEPERLLAGIWNRPH